MAAFGFFRYVYLKALVTFIRSLVLLRDRLSPRIPDSTKWRQIRIPTRDPGRFIEGRAYGPQPEISNGKLPVLINWHGSGFVIPLFGTDHAFCSRVARETGFLVLDVDYRKAPESPYPGPVDDVEDTLRWIASERGPEGVAGRRRQPSGRLWLQRGRQSCTRSCIVLAK
uniref:Alpha/beta hydrolase fold-3 domain-containing protein n=1 Tax=Bionectria ochroleuca TaxID=29856 RepID=A0A8H7NKU3_BIOOC